jgi:hypothetical protein
MPFRPAPDASRADIDFMGRREVRWTPFGERRTLPIAEDATRADRSGVQKVERTNTG